MRNLAFITVCKACGAALCGHDDFTFDGRNPFEMPEGRTLGGAGAGETRIAHVSALPPHASPKPFNDASHRMTNRQGAGVGTEQKIRTHGEDK